LRDEPNALVHTSSKSFLLFKLRDLFVTTHRTKTLATKLSSSLTGAKKSERPYVATASQSFYCDVIDQARLLKKRTMFGRKE